MASTWVIVLHNLSFLMLPGLFFSFLVKVIFCFTNLLYAVDGINCPNTQEIKGFLNVSRYTVSTGWVTKAGIINNNIALNQCLLKCTRRKHYKLALFVTTSILRVLLRQHRQPRTSSCDSGHRPNQTFPGYVDRFLSFFIPLPATDRIY